MNNSRILSEHRPYWWIHESSAYNSLTRPTFYQTERTCETSPGSPSGHMMIASSFLFIMLIFVEKLIVLKSNKYRRPFRYLARLVFALILTVTAISRMYYATHFLHQCIFGIVLGISIAETVMFTKYTDRVQMMDKRKWLKIICAMGAIIASIYWTLKLMKGNPMESVHLVNILLTFIEVFFTFFLLSGFQVLYRPVFPQARNHFDIFLHSCDFKSLWIAIRRATDSTFTLRLATQPIAKHPRCTSPDVHPVAVGSKHPTNVQAAHLLRLYLRHSRRIPIFLRRPHSKILRL